MASLQSVIVVLDDTDPSSESVFVQRSNNYGGSVDKQKRAAKAFLVMRNQISEIIDEYDTMRMDFIPSSSLQCISNSDVERFHACDICLLDVTVSSHRPMLIYHNAVRESRQNVPAIIMLLTGYVTTAFQSGVFKYLLYDFNEETSQCFIPRICDPDFYPSGDDLRQAIKCQINRRWTQMTGRINQMLIDKLSMFQQMPYLKDTKDKPEIEDKIWKVVGEPALTTYQKSIKVGFVARLLTLFRNIHDYPSMVRVDHFIRQSPHLEEICREDLLVQHLLAFGYSRTGDAVNRQKALRILDNTYVDESRVTDHHTMCLYGQIYKDMFVESERTEDRDTAIKWYRKSFKVHPNTYACVNLILLLVISGHTSQSTECTGLVMKMGQLIGSQADIRQSQDVWLVTTAFVYCIIIFKFQIASEIALYIHKLDPPIWCLQAMIADVNLYWHFLNTLQLSGVMSSKLFGESKVILDFWLDFFNDSILKSESTIGDTPEQRLSLSEKKDKLIPALLDTRTNVCNTGDLKLCGTFTERAGFEFFELYINVCGVNDDESHIVLDFIQRSNRNIVLNCSSILSIVRAFDSRALFLYLVSDMDNYKFCFPCPETCTYFFNLINQRQNTVVNPKFCIGRKNTVRSLNMTYTYENDLKGRPILLGQGSFGRVLLARDNDNPLIKYAIKIVNVQLDNPILETFQNEIHILSLLKHKHIVRYYGSTLEGINEDAKTVRLCIVLEYVEGGTLSHYLCQLGPFSEKLIKMYLHQILLGVEYLHLNRIMHRDIKGSNILINKNNGELKIVDFGTCTRLVGCLSSSIQDGIGTVQYMAPDVIKISNKGYGLPADIWSVGCTVIEMATGKPPYPDEQNRFSLFLKIGNLFSHPQVPDHLSDNLKHLLSCCFLPDPEARLSATDLLKHPFFDSAHAMTKLRPNFRQRSYHDSLPKGPSIKIDLSPSLPELIKPGELLRIYRACTPSKDDLLLKSFESRLVSTWIDRYLIDVVRKESNECIRTFNSLQRPGSVDASTVERVLAILDSLLSKLHPANCVLSTDLTRDSRQLAPIDLNRPTANLSSLTLLVPSIMHTLLRKHQKDIPLGLVGPFECIVKRLIEIVILLNYNFASCGKKTGIAGTDESFAHSLLSQDMTTKSVCGELTDQDAHNTACGYLSYHERELKRENALLVEELIATHRKYSTFLQSYIDLLQRSKKAVGIIEQLQNNLRRKQ